MKGTWCWDATNVSRFVVALIQQYIFMLYFDSEAHQNATMCLVLPGAVLHLSVLLAFQDCGNKAGAVRGFQLMEEHNLGQVISTNLHRGSTTVCAYNTVIILILQIYQFKKSRGAREHRKEDSFCWKIFLVWSFCSLVWEGICHRRNHNVSV